MFSQSNEDEIVADIFGRIGEGGKRFVEFGSGDGRQNNTIALLQRGWSGIWLEPHRLRFKSARERFAGYSLTIIRRRVTPRTVNKVVTDPLDFLSIDIDGDDYAVWAALTARPRVVCIEYAEQPAHKNAPPMTLDQMKALGALKGYRFNGTSASCVNAFFVAREV